MKHLFNFVQRHLLLLKEESIMAISPSSTMQSSSVPAKWRVVVRHEDPKKGYRYSNPILTPEEGFDYNRVKMFNEMSNEIPVGSIYDFGGGATLKGDTFNWLESGQDLKRPDGVEPWWKDVQTDLASSAPESKKALETRLADTVKSGETGQMEYLVRKGVNPKELSLSLAKHLYPQKATAYERATKDRLAETVTSPGLRANTVKSLVENGIDPEDFCINLALAGQTKTQKQETLALAKARQAAENLCAQVEVEKLLEGGIKRLSVAA